MIRVERLNGEVIYVNPDLVRTVGAKPDTLITFLDGSTLTIRGPAEDFLNQWLASRQSTPPLAIKDPTWK